LRKKECSLPKANCRGCSDCFLDAQAVFADQEKILGLYRKLASNRPLEEMSDTGIVNLNNENFAMYKSKIRQDLQRGFGLYALKDLEIRSEGKRPNTRYGIGIDKGKIEIVF
jgi:CRISPR-associated protein Csx14